MRWWENGAGKSTLMKILSGIYHKDAGHIFLQDKEVDNFIDRARQDLGISVIHQEINLMNHLTLAQNVFIGREPRGIARFMLDENKINTQTRALFDSMRLNLDPRTKAADLTVAKQQMVEIAKALSFNSQVLIMDEPTAALTEAEIDELFRIIRELRGKGVGIVYISHRLEELKQISDRITVMRDGQTIDTVECRDDRHRPDHLDDGGPDDLRDRAGGARNAQRRDRAGGQESEPRRCHPRCQLFPQEGRDPGLCRTDGRGTHRSRTGGLRR